MKYTPKERSSWQWQYNDFSRNKFKYLKIKMGKKHLKEELAIAQYERSDYE